MARKRIPPWEEIPYFDLPTITVISFGMLSGWIQVVEANIQRVALIISGGPGTRVTPDPTIDVSAGFDVSNTGIPFALQEAFYGPLVTSAWWATNQSPGNVTIAEVILREWPQGE